MSFMPVPWYPRSAKSVSAASRMRSPRVAATAGTTSAPRLDARPVRALARDRAARACPRDDAHLESALGQPAQVHRRLQPPAAEDPDAPAVDVDACRHEPLAARRAHPDAEVAPTGARPRATTRQAEL